MTTESGGQRRQIVIASTMAVIAGLVLAASVYYTFGSGQVPNSTAFAGGSTATLVSTTTIVNTTTVTNTVVNLAADSIDCSNVSGRPLYLGSQPIRLAPGGTSSVNGIRYWYATFIPMWNGTSQSTIQFQGVNFTVTAPYPSGGIRVGETWILRNTTFLTTSTHGGMYCGYELPPVKVSFGDGSSVVYNGETVAVGANGGTITFDRPSGNPWFTQHTAPQAGLGYQLEGGEITLYVSS